MKISAREQRDPQQTSIGAGLRGKNRALENGWKLPGTRLQGLDGPPEGGLDEPAHTKQVLLQLDQIAIERLASCHRQKPFPVRGTILLVHA